MIVAKNIHKHFDGRHILNNVNLTVEPGKITCLIGPSGTGKTTLLRALSLLECPEHGSVEIDGCKYAFPLKHPKEIVPPWPDLTVVFQSLFLWPHLTLRENILLPARNRKHGDLHAELEEIIDFFDMRPFIDNYPNEASLGQRQRVALARAFMLKPKYILLDEITSSLDVEQVAKILTRLKEMRDRGIGIFIITHLLGFARNTADHVAFMSEGAIVENGTSEILVNPKSHRLKQFLSIIQDAS